MDDCMAAMVLMSLSCSPKSPMFTPDGVTFPHSWSSFDSGLTTNSTASRSNSPTPPVDTRSDAFETYVQKNKAVKRVSSFDEGIEIDENLKFEEDLEDSGQHHRRVLFRCTWPGCAQLSNDCEDIERHVRVTHLGRSDAYLDEESDHEEEFYYTEVEMRESESCSPLSSFSSHGHLPSSLPHCITKSNTTTNNTNNGGQSPVESPGPLVESDGVPFFGSSSAPTWSHLDMVRPPHEDPEYKQKFLVDKPEVVPNNQTSDAAPKCLISHPINIPGISFAQHYARPLNLSSPKAANFNNGNKYMRLNGNSKSGTTLLQSPSKLNTVSPTRRTRGETRKCRKQYGMENRDSWCTQCKWKKACSRFVD